MTPDRRPVEFVVVASRLILAWVLFSHAVVFTLLLISPLTGWQSVLLCGSVLAGLGLSLRQWYARGRLSLFWRDGGWSVRGGGGEERPLTLNSYFRLARSLMLVFKERGKTRRLLILPDSTSPDELRRLHQLIFLGQTSFSAR